MSSGSKRTYLSAAVFFLLVLCTMPAWTRQLSSSDEPEVFVGEITDSYCAKNGSHEKLINEMKNMGHDKRTCTLKCVESGAKLVLYDSSRNAVYTLKDPDRAFPFMGEKVRITGSLRKHELTIDAIENLK